MGSVIVLINSSSWVKLNFQRFSGVRDSLPDAMLSRRSELPIVSSDNSSSRERESHTLFPSSYFLVDGRRVLCVLRGGILCSKDIENMSYYVGFSWGGNFLFLISSNTFSMSAGNLSFSNSIVPLSLGPYTISIFPSFLKVTLYALSLFSRFVSSRGKI